MSSGGGKGEHVDRAVVDEAGYHVCPAIGCEAMVPYAKLSCRKDWYRLPQAIRNQVNRAWYGPGAGSDEHNRALLAAYTWYREHP